MIRPKSGFLFLEVVFAALGDLFARKGLQD